MNNYGAVFAIVFELAGTVVGSLFLGGYLDKQFHLENVLTIALTILGFIIGFYRMTVRLKSIMGPDA